MRTVIHLQLCGFVPPLVTPLHESGCLDCDALYRLTKVMIEAGADALFALGTSGEFVLLSEDTKKQVVSIILSAAAAKTPVLVGVSDANPTVVRTQIKWVEQSGAAAVVLCPPFYFPFSRNELRCYFMEMISYASIPVVLYNIPSLSHNWIDVELAKELVRNERVLGIKDSSGDLVYFQELLRAVKSVRQHCGVMQGRESLSAASLLMGADGLVPGIGNLAPELCVDLIKAARIQDIAEVRQLQRRLSELEAIYNVGTKAIAGLKAAMAVDGGYPRWTAWPNAALDLELMPVIERVLSKGGVDAL